MKNYLLITPGYPSRSNVYNNAFVHSRIKQYKKRGLRITVFSVVRHNQNLDCYMFEGVEVICGDIKSLSRYLHDHDFTKILIHFGWVKIMKSVLREAPKTPLVVWVHGVEALGWYRRLFNFNLLQAHRFIGYILMNSYQMYGMRQQIIGRDNITYVFVSKWMKDIVETDTMTRGMIRKFAIIPNVVDTSLFSSENKDASHRMKILSVRPYSSRKYANDISVEAITLLSKNKIFPHLEFELVGDGRLFDKTLKPLRCFANVHIEQGFLKQQDIVKKHKNNGIFLCPTRQDAQGVSMCEAMSSGLVPITSDNTAIPEFVSEDCGYLTKNAEDIAQAIIELYEQPQKFKSFSIRAAEQIRRLCSPNIVIDDEISIITKGDN